MHPPSPRPSGINTSTNGGLYSRGMLDGRRRPRSLPCAEVPGAGRLLFFFGVSPDQTIGILPTHQTNAKNTTHDMQATQGGVGPRIAGTPTTTHKTQNTKMRHTGTPTSGQCLYTDCVPPWGHHGGPATSCTLYGYPNCPCQGLFFIRALTIQGVGTELVKPI